jgi:hypothetical protein
MLIEQHLITNWGLRSVAEKLNFRLNWGIQNAVQASSLSLVWNVLRELDKVFIFNWGIIRTTFIAKHCRNYVYPCSERIASCSVGDCAKGTTNQLTKLFTFKWNLGLVTKSLDLLWDLDRVDITVTSVSTFKWDID